jgi:hypothetical protein
MTMTDEPTGNKERRRGPNPSPRFDFAPFERQFTLKYGVDPIVLEQEYNPKLADREQTDGRIGWHVRRDRYSIYRYRHEGLTLRAADEFASFLDMHPVMIWPEFVEIVEYSIEEDDDV